jgi:hypothetical protein
LEISSRFKKGEYNGANLFGIIKEVAPVSGAETDEILGVSEFQSKYFHDYPVYLDSEKTFYSYLGDKSLLSQPLHSWNPFRLWSDYQYLKTRLETKGIEGNLKGEGLLKGGLLIMKPPNEVFYQFEEQTGSEMPYTLFGEMLNKLKSEKDTCSREPQQVEEDKK